jgi:hypothetical protein
MDTPFVDPADQEENVRTLNGETTQEMRSMVLAHLITGIMRSFLVLMLLLAGLYVYLYLLYRCIHKRPLNGDTTQEMRSMVLAHFDYRFFQYLTYFSYFIAGLY